MKILFRLLLLMTALGLMLTGRVTAQTFTTLHSFSAGTGYWWHYTNTDGTFPGGPWPNTLVLCSNTLYGTAFYGGSSGNGTVFKVNTDGTEFTTLYNFTASDTNGINNDGAYPGGLILSSNTLYGTASGGGSSGYGSVFAINTDGMGFETLHSFTALSFPNSGTNSDGANPQTGLILVGNALYGTASGGGGSWVGTVFKVNTDGSGFTDVHDFNLYSDGGYPAAGFVLSGNTLYGTATSGGTNPPPDEGYGNGTVFKVNTDGTGFTVLHYFTALPLWNSGVTNSDGNQPRAELVLSGNTVYGTTSTGGISDRGTVFSVNTNGTDFTTLHAFTASSGGSDIPGGPGGINSDGAYPGGLIKSGNTLYGAAVWGGISGNGTVFSVNIDGSAFTTLYNFSVSSTNSSGVYTNSDGAYPGGLVLSGNTLFGTAGAGGSAGNGTVFSISFTPQLTTIPSGSNLILAWPTNFTGYTLQSTTNLVSPAWTTNLPAPVVVNGQNTVTNPISGTQQFYRLSQ